MPVAGAVTVAELQAQIAALTAQLAALSGGTAAAGCYAFTVDLHEGSSGADVTALQNYLAGKGLFTATATGFFGPITKAAVAAWQTANGVAPAYGYFGPLSRAKYSAICTPASGGETGETGGTGELSGGAGSADYKLMSGLTNEEVGEDAEDVEVAGLEVEAQGSDLELTALRLVFVQGTADNDFEEYASEVSVFLDDKELGRADADEFNDSNNWTSTLTLDGGVIKEDETGELVVAVSGATNIDTADLTETWTVDFRSVRYTDAQGASVSEDPATATRTFSFESFATSEDIRLKIKETNTPLINKGHLINVDATEETTGVVLLDATLEAEGDSDLEFREFGVDFVVAGASHVDEVIQGGTSPAAHLYIDGEEYGTATYYEDLDGEDVGTDEQILWDDVDYTLTAGETVPLQIKIDIDGLDGTPDLGDTIYAQITETETDDTAIWDVRDDSNTQLADADITGTADGEASELRDVGFDLALVGTPTAVKAPGNASASTSDSGLFTIVFDVTAWDGDIYIDHTDPDDAGGATESDLNVTGTGTLTATLVTSSGATHTANDTILVGEDETERFTITADVRDGAVDLVDGFHDVSLGSLLYALTAVDGDLVYTFNLGDFITPQIYLDDLE